METHKAINIEKLIPSTLLEDERSDIESVSNENIEQELNLRKVELKNNMYTEQVSHILYIIKFTFYNIFYRTKMKMELNLLKTNSMI